MGFFSAIAPSVIGAVGGLLGNKSSNDASAKAAAAANQFTEKQLKNRHQWEVNDLRKAGLNPILSAGGTPSIGGSAKADVFDTGEAVSRGVSSALSANLIKAQIDNLKTQSVNQLAQAGAADATAGSVRQFTDIKKPIGDAMRAVGDVSSSALSKFREFKANPGKTEFPSPLSIFKKLRGK